LRSNLRSPHVGKQPDSKPTINRKKQTLQHLPLVIFFLYSRVVRMADVLRGLVVFFLCSQLPYSVASAQTIVRSFDGDKGMDLATCKPETMRCRRQPEMDAAVNGRQVVQVTRQDVNVYDYSGKLVRSTPMTEFIRNAGLDPMAPASQGGLGPYEPHVIYEEFVGRWIVTVTCLSDCLLVSTSSDPLGPWRGVYLSCLERGPCLNYDPALHIGFDKNGIYYCGGHLGDENPHTVPQVAYDCFAVPSAEVRAIAQGTAPTHINRQHNMPLDVVPAIDHNPRKSARDPAFFVAKTCGRDKPAACLMATNLSFEWLVNTFTWNGASGTYSAGHSEQRVKTDVGSRQNKWLYNMPCCGPRSAIPQAGSDLPLRSGSSHRLMNLVQFGHHLYGAMGSGPCTSECGSQGTDPNNIMFWVDLDCSKPAACVVSQTAKISGPDFTPLFGTVGVDQHGNIGIAAASVTATSNLSVLLWSRRKTDPPNTFRGPITVITGTQPYTCPPADKVTLIGNAAGLLTALDPLDGTKLWTTEQWSNTVRPCVWNTRIFEYQIEEHGSPQAPDSAQKSTSGTR